MLTYFVFIFQDGRTETKEETEIYVGQEMAVWKKEENAMATIALY